MMIPTSKGALVCDRKRILLNGVEIGSYRWDYERKLFRVMIGGGWQFVDRIGLGTKAIVEAMK